MSRRRKLDDQKEREVALSYLSGVSLGYIQESWGISKSNVVTLIVGRRSRDWNDPLVEFYRETDSRQRLRNSAHLYLAFHGREVPRRELVAIREDRVVYEVINDAIYGPVISGIIDHTALDRFVFPTNGYEQLMQDVFGAKHPVGIVEPIFVDRLDEEYQRDGRFSIDNVEDDVRRSLILKIKYGGLAVTPRKVEIIQQALGTLSKRDAEVLSLHYGLSGITPKSDKELGDRYGLARSRVEQIKERAIRQLRDVPWRSRILHPITQLMTDSELEDYLSTVETRHTSASEILASEIDEYELSVRASNVLRAVGIRFIKDLVMRTPEGMLRYRNIGEKTLAELDELLASLGLPTFLEKQNRIEKERAKGIKKGVLINSLISAQ